MCRASEEPIYGNYNVLDPGGRLMFRCGEKKWNWYLKKGLADQVSETSIQLNFKPNGLGYVQNSFFLQDRQNRCVVCGSESDLSRHHVVPHCYRKHFPDLAKDHNYHDVLPLCTDCHTKYETEHSYEYRRQLSDQYVVPLAMTKSDKIRIVRERAIKAARSLVRYNLKIPAVKKVDLLLRVESFIQCKANKKRIEAVSNLGLHHSHRAVYSPDHSEIVVEKIQNLQKFVEGWRRNFLETMQPKFMPHGWTVDADVFAGRTLTDGETV